jgi:hypothetical protein
MTSKRRQRFIAVSVEAKLANMKIGNYAQTLQLKVFTQTGSMITLLQVKDHQIG